MLSSDQRDDEVHVKSPVLMNSPIAKSSESPGRIGKSSPHSTKTMATLIQKNWSEVGRGATGGPSSWC